MRIKQLDAAKRKQQESGRALLEKLKTINTVTAVATESAAVTEKKGTKKKDKELKKLKHSKMVESPSKEDSSPDVDFGRFKYLFLC